jgi:ABC-type sugar transport system ATPase subunit
MSDIKLFEDKLYRVDEVALKLKISKRSVYRLLEDPLSNIDCIRIRSSIRVQGKSLNQYLENNQIEV